MNRNISDVMSRIALCPWVTNPGKAYLLAIAFNINSEETAPSSVTKGINAFNVPRFGVTISGGIKPASPIDSISHGSRL